MFTTTMSTLAPATAGPQLPRENNSVGTKLMELIEFWKLKKQSWVPPSRFVRSFQHLFNALAHVRDMDSNADVALERLFPEGVSYIFGTTVSDFVVRESPF